ncbi:MAG: hypothetical protein IPJ39_17365 [Saprospiraceae bacterium]|nr:hypothetical protein [Saprospiraceae bacterium]
MVSIGLDCNDTDPLSQGFALETNIMESSGIPNDGIVCSGSPATITVDGPIAFLLGKMDLHIKYTSKSYSYYRLSSHSNIIRMIWQRHPSKLS